jgi:hypothetical protein
MSHAHSLLLSTGIPGSTTPDSARLLLDDS